MATARKRIKLVKTNKVEIENLLQVLNEIEAIYNELNYYSFENLDLSDYEILNTFRKESLEDFIEDLFHHISNIHFQRILWNSLTMLENCTDPDQDTLEFHPDIKQGLELLEKSNDKLPTKN